MGADAGAYLGASGATTQGLNDAKLGAQVIIYARAKGGIFAGASIGNAAINSDEKANRELYGRKMTALEIVRDGTVTIPEAARSFMAALPQGSPTTASN